MEAEFTRYHDSWRRYADRSGSRSECCYRIHWSGDCFSPAYAYAMRRAMGHMAGKMRFWGYSRMPCTADIMLGAVNCSWYLSVDDATAPHVLGAFLGRHPGIARDATNLSVAYMSKVRPDTQMHFNTCPADTGTIPYAGACRICGGCIVGRPVWFKSK